MHPETSYKICQFCENCARHMPLWGIYIMNFGKISVKISLLGVLYPYRCTDGGEIWHGGPSVHSSMPISPHRCNVSLLQGNKPQNRPLSNLYTSALHCVQFCR